MSADDSAITPGRIVPDVNRGTESAAANTERNAVYWIGSLRSHTQEER